MTGDILIGILAAFMPAVIMMKGDKQMVHLLEGKLHRRGQDTGAAVVIYGKHKEQLSFALFVGGFWITVAAVVFLGVSPTGLAVTLVGLGAALFGVWGRVKSFQAADEELG